MASRKKSPRRPKSKPAEPPPSKRRVPYPGASGDVGRDRGKEELDAFLDATENDLTPKRKAGKKPTRKQQLREEMESMATREFLGEVVDWAFRLPCGRGSRVSQYLKEQGVEDPDEALASIPPDVVWPLSEQEKSIYGFCLRVLLLQKGERWMEHAPFFVLGLGVIGSIAARVWFSVKIGAARARIKKIKAKEVDHDGETES